MLVLVFSCVPTPAQAAWQQKNGNWYYTNSNGTPVTGWFKDGNTWYYLDSNGAMVTGQHTIDGKTYSFNSNGATRPDFTLKINTRFCITLVIGETRKIDYTYTGDKSMLTWISGAPYIVAVDDKGVLTAKEEGATCIALTDGDLWELADIRVIKPEDQTAYFNLDIDGPLYDGVVEHVGDRLQFHNSTSCRKTNGEYNNRIIGMEMAGQPSDPTKENPKDPQRNYYITSSDTSVISVTNEYDCGFYQDFLRFKKAGTAVITITSWDGYSESYTIHVKADYDCNLALNS